MNKNFKQETEAYDENRRNKGWRSRVRSKNPAVFSNTQTNIDALDREYPNVWNMTSKDFHADPIAQLDDVASQMRDSIAMATFRTVILENRHFFAERTILVIGCSMFTIPLWAVKAGASAVYVIDKSNVVDYMRNIVAFNKLGNKIQVLQGSIADIELPVPQVDVIVSNWMGYSLLSESKCREVIMARDKWLKRNGVILPDRGQLFVAGFSSGEKKNGQVNWWNDVYGFSMKAMRAMVLKMGVNRKVDKREMLSMPYIVMDLDLKVAKIEDLTVNAKFTLTSQRYDLMDGIFTYFKVDFSKSHKRIILSTSPNDHLTNWQQTVLFFDSPLTLYAGDKFQCSFVMKAVEGQEILNDLDVCFEMSELASANSIGNMKIEWRIGEPPLTESNDNVSEGEPLTESNDNVSEGEEIEEKTEEEIPNEKIFHS